MIKTECESGMSMYESQSGVMCMYKWEYPSETINM